MTPHPNYLCLIIIRAFQFKVWPLDGFSDLHRIQQIGRIEHQFSPAFLDDFFQPCIQRVPAAW